MLRENQENTVKKAILTLVALSCILPNIVHAQAVCQPVSWRNIQIQDQFWQPRQKALFTSTLPQQFEQLDINKYRQNFERAAKRESGGYVGLVFNDSDVYKVLEAASFALGLKRDPAIEAKVDAWIDLIGKAQMPDGYLNCYFQLNEPNAKWSNLRDQHELYCAGHLFEAAAAHYEATGKRTLLNIATKLADHIDRRFGEGKRMGYPGHPETELALFKLWRVTGENRYFKLSEFFLNNRGKKFFATEHSTPLKEYEGAYWSDNELLRDHVSIVGHAVRAAYLFSGATDLAMVKADPPLVEMLERVWRSNTEKRMFLTGGLGPSGSNEGFTVDYDLPTFSAYQESCASIANALWNHRLALLHGHGKYADVMETALYNGALAGINTSGDRYYYVNPLASHGNHHRQGWFACACCPPNLARMLGQLGGQIYAESNDSAYVMLYIASDAKLNIGGENVQLTVKSNYPYSGNVSIRVQPSSPMKFALKLRKPDWADSAQISVNGKNAEATTKNGFLSIDRAWKAGDTVKLVLPMPVRRVLSHPSVKETLGQYALARGPLIYCLEQSDNAFDFDVAGFPLDRTTKTVKTPFFGETVAIDGEAIITSEQEWRGRLFNDIASPKTVKFRAIPYCFWDNRGPGEMRVWLNPNPKVSPLRGFERKALVGVSFANTNSAPGGVNDGYVPESSNPNSPRQLHFWNHEGGIEWVTYTFKEEITARQSRVFWFDDSGRGACKLPQWWKLEAKIDGQWREVKLDRGDAYGVKLDIWNEVNFAPVTSREFRLTVRQQDKWSSGIHEWQLF
jgi:uncharacterized protein